MSSFKNLTKPTLNTQKSQRLSLFAKQTRSPDSSALLKTKPSNSIHFKTPIAKTERAKTFNFSENEMKPELKKWDAVGKIDRSINILKKTRGQRDLSFQVKVEDLIHDMMKLCNIDERVVKFTQQILEEREQKKASQLQTLKFIKGQQDQIEQLRRRCEEYY